MFLIFVLSEDETEILAKLYTNSFQRLLWVAQKYLGADRAQDAVHDVFLKLTKNENGNFSKIRDKEEVYFVTIVKHHCIDIIRKESRTPIDYMDDDFIFIDTVSNPERLVEEQSQLDGLTTLIEHLIPNYRQILEYKYIIGYTNAEISKELGISISVVTTRLNRAKNKLKSIIDQMDQKEETPHD